MSEPAAKKVKLRGGPRNTMSWAELLPSGALEVGYYDFSDETEERLGSESEWIITVGQEDVLSRSQSEQDMEEDGEYGPEVDDEEYDSAQDDGDPRYRGAADQEYDDQEYDPEDDIDYYDDQDYDDE